MTGQASDPKTDSEKPTETPKRHRRTPEDWKRIASRYWIVWIVVLGYPLPFFVFLRRSLNPRLIEALRYIHFLLITLVTTGVVAAELRSCPRRPRGERSQKHQPRTVSDWQHLAALLRAAWPIGALLLLGWVYASGTISPRIRRSISLSLLSPLFVMTVARVVVDIFATTRSPRRVPTSEWPQRARRIYLRLALIGLVACPVSVALTQFPFSWPRAETIRTLGWVLLVSDLFLIGFSFLMAYIAQRKVKAQRPGSTGQNQES